MQNRRRAPASMPRRLGSSLLAALPLALAIDLAVMTSAAAEPLATNAERLFAEGLRFAHGGDCAHARDRFTESYAADPAPGTLINWALCEERLSRSATALELLLLADQTLPANHPKRAGMVKHIESLTKRAPLFRVRLLSALPTGATVAIDGALVEATSFERPLLRDPGPHQIEVRAPGREDRRYDVVLVEGRTVELTVQPGLPRETQLGKTAPVVPPDRVAPAAMLGWALAGGGLAAVGVGAVTGLLAKGKWDEVARDCDVDNKVCRTDSAVQASRSGGTLATVSTAAFVAGGLGLTIGGYLLLTKKDAPASARLTTSAGPAMVGFRLSGEF